MRRMIAGLMLFAVAACTSDKKAEPNQEPTEAPPKTAVVAPSHDTKLGSMAAKQILGTAGFDWLSPKASCKVMAADDLQMLQEADAQCERMNEDLFGVGEREVTHCKFGKAEWLLFPSSEICTEMLETMNANAP